ncbi:MAG: sulfatase-like hydrolase/transferase [Armatimonadia bacterium]|nr:sulfatase-like hydrolase/transferase [Armatimonadia bacterium]
MMKPNILFFYPDQHRYDWTPLNRSLPLRMPNLELLMGRGVSFRRAICPSPLSAPSRACLASGMRYPGCGVTDNGDRYPLDLPTHYQRLRDEAGYHVIACGKFDLNKPEGNWGIDGKNDVHEWGFSDGINSAGKYDAVNMSAGEPDEVIAGHAEPGDPYMAYLYEQGLAKAHIEDLRHRGHSTDPTPLPDHAYSDNFIGRHAVRLLREAPRNRPWYLTVNFTGPHNPWDVTESMWNRWRGVDFSQPVASTKLTPEHHVGIRRNYAAMVENIDRWIGLILMEVARRDETNRTLVVYSSDHGEMLGDHDRFGKSVPWQPSVGVPLVVAGPGVDAGRTTHAPAENSDLAATFLETASLEPGEDVDSCGLWPVLTGQVDANRDVVVSALRGWRVIIDRNLKLVHTDEDECRLYDLDQDPAEQRDLAPEHPGEVRRLRDRLDRELGAPG